VLEQKQDKPLTLIFNMIAKKKEKKRAEKSFNFTWQMILLGINAK
jgi:hypothetical protein